MVVECRAQNTRTAEEPASSHLPEGRSSREQAHAVLATVMFVNIVDSTQRAVAIGDRAAHSVECRAAAAHPPAWL
jgi:hypothetical protein